MPDWNKLTEHAQKLADQEWGPLRTGNRRIDRYLDEIAESSKAIPEVFNSNWYVVVTESQKEAIATIGLISRRFAAYYPVHPKSISSNYHKRRIVNRPLLPGYIFASFDPTESRWKAIPGINGVRRIISVDERPIPVPEAALRFIRQREQELQTDFRTRKRWPMPVAVGAWVQITDHTSFGGLFGRVIQLLAEKGKLVLEIELLSRKTRVELPAHSIRAV